MQRQIVVVDTREQKNHVTDFLNEHGVENIRSKVYVGDYTLLHDQSVCIDRKQHLSEVCSNVCQGHARFRAELMRAQAAHVKLIILVEHGRGIKTIQDVMNWENPRLKKSPYAMSGEALYKRMVTMADKYGVEWVFCKKQNTGLYICSLLGVDVKLVK